MSNTKEYNHQYYLEHMEKFRAKGAKWTEENREKMRECNRRCYRNNKERQKRESI